MQEFDRARRDSLARYLARHTAGEVRFDDTSRHLYSTDASHYAVPPLGVVLPKTEADLAAAVEIAAELEIPVTPRGGGTSLSGQAIGPGLVIDSSKYLNRVVAIDPAARTARVQPGLVLSDFNRGLAPHHLTFGPDVATADRATLGGMIGNNSAGARSIVYGQTVDHVRGLRCVLSDGTTATFATLPDADHARKLELRTREGDAYRAADRVVKENAAEVRRRTPDIVRKVSGYNLLGLVTNPRSLVSVVVGSEGTLAVVAEAELALVPLPKFRGLLVPQFDSLRAALDAVAACLALGPSAVELMDQMLLDLARTQRGLKDTMAAVRGRPAALLMAEFSGDTAAEVADKIHKLSAKLAGAAGLTAAVTATDAATRDPLWSLRGAAVPLLYGMPGDRKPITFVEDAAVAPERMPEFATRFREILRRHGTEGAFYGHASVGCLHIRPVLNLHASAGVAAMRAIMTDVTDLVLEFGGSLSGEHGDGLVRSEWNAKMFGPVVYRAFCDVKRGFDPLNILNPGKIVHAPPMDANLRVPPDSPTPDPPTVFDYAAQGGFFRSIELCNGAGVCRKTQGGAMCPSYRATKDEQDSTRGRANALRVAVLGKDEGRRMKDESPRDSGSSFVLRPSSLQDRWLKPVMDLCLSCKACKSECPSNVDLAKLKAEFLHAYYARRPRPLGDRLVRRVDTLFPLGAAAAGPANWLARRPAARRILESVAGIDRRRSLPPLFADHFRRWFRRRPRPPADARPRVVLLDDCFTTFQEPHLGRLTVELAERAGFRVELASICCGRAAISKGYLTDARNFARTGVAKLAAAAAAGVPILGLEPSCILTLADEWPELVPGDAAKKVAAAAELAEVWLTRQPTLAFAPLPGKVLFHPHCHQKALVGPGGTAAALKCTSADVITLDAGCCGMAGAFGYEKRHYDISMTIANLALVPALAAAPAAEIIATGTSCRHQIGDSTGRRALHPVERLAAAVTTEPHEGPA